MTQSRRLLTAMVGLGMVLAVAVGEAGEAKQPRGKLMHFGNMGGLMPTLQRKDLPEPESEAADLVFKLCGQCHNSPGPGLHTVKEWETIFWRMYWRMHLMNAQFEHFMVPTFGEGELMFAYLKKHAMRPIALSKVDMARTGAREYATYCGQCHQLPDPQLHQSAAWEGVIRRMNGHMMSMSKNIPSPREMADIQVFLESNAAP